jgi:hypothetical protein
VATPALARGASVSSQWLAYRYEPTLCCYFVLIISYRLYDSSNCRISPNDYTNYLHNFNDLHSFTSHPNFFTSPSHFYYHSDTLLPKNRGLLHH